MLRFISAFITKFKYILYLEYILESWTLFQVETNIFNFSLSVSHNIQVSHLKITLTIRNDSLLLF